MTPAERDTAILSQRGQVDILARRAYRKSPCELPDLIQAAWLGVAKAVDTWDVTKGAALDTWAYRYIQWSIQDFQRLGDPLPRQKRAQGETLYMQSIGEREAKIIPSKPHDLETALTLRSLLAAISPDHRELLERYYINGERLEHMASEWGVKPARMSQILALAMEAARRKATVCGTRRGLTYLAASATVTT